MREDAVDSMWGSEGGWVPCPERVPPCLGLQRLPPANATTCTTSCCPMGWDEGDEMRCVWARSHDNASTTRVRAHARSLSRRDGVSNDSMLIAGSLRQQPRQGLAELTIRESELALSYNMTAYLPVSASHPNTVNPNHPKWLPALRNPPSRDRVTVVS